MRICSPGFHHVATCSRKGEAFCNERGGAGEADGAGGCVAARVASARSRESECSTLGSLHARVAGTLHCAKLEIVVV
jgi:hypothetical protein